MSTTTADRQGHDQDTHAVGFWLYLMSDGIIFALLFATYGVMRHAMAGAPPPSAQFELTHTALETLLLLTSTLTCGLALAAARDDRRSLAIGWLAATGLLGAGFVAMEISEFAGMIGAGAGPDRSGALSAFFTLVGTHGLHVSIGLLWLMVMAAQLVVMPNDQVLSRLERFALFWHFLDLVWIGIFSLVYLPGML